MEKGSTARRMIRPNVRYTPKELEELLINILTDRMLPEKDALIVLDSMLKADCCGVGTHGIRMLPSYAEKLDNGFFNIGNIEILKQTASFTTVDAKNIIGSVSACECTKIAVEMAEKSGLHAVFARNCNTFGAAFYYTEMIEKQGMIGMVCSNSPAAMPAYNGAEAMLGTNPIAFACPSSSEGTVRFDMSTSVVAKSKIGVLNQKKEKLPEGWALDSEGKPTVDPQAAINGLLLPMAGFKGYSLAMAIDIVAGVLSGANYLNGVNKFYSRSKMGMNAGQLFIAIDPKQIYEGDFQSEMDRYIEILRASKKAGNDPIVIPGDRGRLIKEKNLQEGIEIPKETVEKLNLLICGGGKYSKLIEKIKETGVCVTILFDERQTVEEPERYDAVICNSLFLYNDIKLFKKLKYIQLLSAGYDRIPYKYITEAGIELHNAHDVYSIPIAEFTITKILDFYKKSRFFYDKQSRKEWIKNRELGELYSKSALIVGCGSIGSEIAKRLQAFEVHVIGINRRIVCNPYVDESRTMVDLRDTVKNADILICTLPLSEDTRNLFGKDIFDAMKPSSLFVNVSRGGVVNTDDLVKALIEGKIAGAILDVFEEEPLDRQNILWTLPNVILSPHNAFEGEGNEERLLNIVLHHLIQWMVVRFATSF